MRPHEGRIMISVKTLFCSLLTVVNTAGVHSESQCPVRRRIDHPVTLLVYELPGHQGRGEAGRARSPD